MFSGLGLLRQNYSPELRRILAVGGILFFVITFSLKIAPTGELCPALWLSNGILLAVTLRRPGSTTPAYLLAAAVAQIAASAWLGKNLEMTAIVAIANLCEVATATKALKRNADAAVLDPSKPEVLKELVLFGVILVPSATAIIVALVLNLANGAPLYATARGWFLSHAFGVLAATPLLLSMRGVSIWQNLRPLGNTFAIDSFVLTATFAIFGQSNFPLAFLLFPVLTFAALRLDFFNAALVTMLSSILILLLTLQGRGPFTLLQQQPILESPELILVFLITATLMTLAAASDLGSRRALQRSLQAEEETHKRLVELSRDMIFRVNLDGAARFVSPASLKIFGYHPEEMIGQSPVDRVHPEDLPIVTSALEQILKGDESVIVSHRVKHRDGHWLWVEGSLRPVFDPDTGAPCEVFGSIRDVTARLNAEIALRESEERFRGAFETAGHGMALVDTKGRILRINRAACAMLGRSEAELLTRDFQSFTHPDDIDMNVSQMLALLAGEVDSYQMEKRYIHGLGHTVWAQLSVSLVRTQAGTPIHFVSHFQDITRNKQAEIALKQSEERFRMLYNKTPVMMHSLDAQGQILTVNDHWLESLGYTREEVIGRRSVEFLTPESRIFALEGDLPKAFVFGAIDGSQLQAVKKDGQIIDILLSSIAQYDAEGTVTGSLTVSIDVTARRQAEQALKTAREEAERANRAKSIFLATMSHEIRTPLNAILGFADLLMDSAFSVDQRHKLQYLKEASSSLLAIVNDILDFSKIEAGKLDLEMRPFDVRELTEKTMGIVSDQAASKGLVTRLSVNAAVPSWVVGDPIRVRQVLLNFLSNAIKFTEMGSVELLVEPDDEAGPDHLRFSVIDTGIGIPIDRQNLLFRNFSQIDQPEARGVGGTGLGLAISKLIMDAMPDGRIGATCEAGRGSRFWCSAQFMATQEQNTNRRRSVSADRILTSPARILVADDVHLNQMVIEMLLTHAGHAVTIAKNGMEAIVALEREEFDMVFMDMEMPVMDGIAATKAIRAFNDDRVRRIPIIALTANALMEQGNACREAGMDDFLTKPIDRHVLMDTVSRWANARSHWTDRVKASEVC